MGGFPDPNVLTRPDIWSIILISGPFAAFLSRGKEMRYRVIPVIIFLLFSLDLRSSASAQPQIGEKIPEFTASALDGKEIALKDYWEQQGKKILVLSFFATWCHPCKEDLPYLQKVQDQYEGSGLQVVCLLTMDQSNAGTVRKFMKKLGVNLPVLGDERGRIAELYKVRGLPCNFVVDQEGILRAKYLGYSEDVKTHFENGLKKLFSIHQ